MKSIFSKILALVGLGAIMADPKNQLFELKNYHVPEPHYGNPAGSMKTRKTSNKLAAKHYRKRHHKRTISERNRAINFKKAS